MYYLILATPHSPFVTFSRLLFSAGVTVSGDFWPFLSDRFFSTVSFWPFVLAVFFRRFLFWPFFLAVPGSSDFPPVSTPSVTFFAVSNWLLLVAVSGSSDFPPFSTPAVPFLAVSS